MIGTDVASLRLRLPKLIASVAIAPAVICNSAPVSYAAREIGNIPTSGLVFKDSLRVNAFEDPKVKGVELYIADFDRPLTEKLSSDLFADPSSSSLACAQTGPVTVSPDISTSSEGEEVFGEARNLFFKVGNRQ